MRLMLQLDRPNAGEATFDGRALPLAVRTRRRRSGRCSTRRTPTPRAPRGTTSGRSPRRAACRRRGSTRSSRRSVSPKSAAGGSAASPSACASVSAWPPPSSATRTRSSSTSPPTGSTPKGMQWIRQLLTYLAGQGRTVFVSSHLLSEMALMADHVVVIGKGRLIADSSVERLRRPLRAHLGPGAQPPPRRPRPDPPERTVPPCSTTGPDSADVFGADAAAVGDLAASFGRRAARALAAVVVARGGVPRRHAGRPGVRAHNRSNRSRASMIAAVRSEWIKLRSARSNLVLLVLAVTLPIALTLLLTAHGLGHRRPGLRPLRHRRSRARSSAGSSSACSGCW